MKNIVLKTVFGLVVIPTIGIIVGSILNLLWSVLFRLDFWFVQTNGIWILYFIIIIISVIVYFDKMFKS